MQFSLLLKVFQKKEKYMNMSHDTNPLLLVRPGLETKQKIKNPKLLSLLLLMMKMCGDHQNLGWR